MYAIIDTFDAPIGQVDGACPPPIARVAVLGSGAWGTALAVALRRSGARVALWTRRADLAHAIQTQNRNPRHLPGIDLPAGLRADTDMAKALCDADCVIIAVPCAALRQVARRAAGLLGRHRVPVLAACKGIEHGTGALMTEVLREELGRGTPVGSLGGPSFAHEVAQGLPTVLTLAMPALNAASPDARLARDFARKLHRQLAPAGIGLELTDDAVGAQVGGALKNMIAIACGMATARGLGENARAAIVTRGLDDMRRLTVALGGRVETLLSSCGAGDLFLTCSSEQSRNTRLGLRLGRNQAAGDTEELAEGVASSVSVRVLEQRLGLRLHVARAVRDVLMQHVTPERALERLIHAAPADQTKMTIAQALTSAPKTAHETGTLRPAAQRQPCLHAQ
ncbi:NAD(P)H-dependent glycerol-3-phosphate dehydrogenase [Thiomonas delicata]|uniref:Glycerol-3-phosphate dehydrogenase [NAD(P)+] n=1 Tax=Thiomonas delicata TaxID=364030 RepID=A0A238CZQ7_THIDL|nr:NAD(P)H-dependent glycerol-3-phosphate dehydrogenase [Thiomonas delicata]SBP86481.1 Glycerol-3-phosphate dehydrogenase (NAD(P)+) [Thiomonas delicata]